MNRLARRRTWRGVFTGLTVAASLVSSHAQAEEPAASEPSAVALSEQHAAEAYQAYSRKEYAAAVALYLKAYEAAPNGSILYNIARIYETKLADRPLAITYYRRYIADPGAYTERIEFANQRLKQLRETEALSEKLGDSERTSEQSAERAAARDLGERAALEQEPRAKPREEAGWSGVRWAGITLGGAGIAALGIGAGFGVAAMSRASTAHELCDENACSSQRGVNAANSAERAATISNIGFAVGGGLFLTGLTLFFIGADDSAERRPGVALAVDGSASSAALRVSGRW
jgi:hypothetical protein